MPNLPARARREPLSPGPTSGSRRLAGWLPLLLCACQPDPVPVTVSFVPVSDPPLFEEISSYTVRAAYISADAYQPGPVYSFGPTDPDPHFQLRTTAQDELLQLFVTGLAPGEDGALQAIATASSSRFTFTGEAPLELQLFLGRANTLNTLGTPLSSPRSGHSTTWLDDGTLLFAGGLDASGHALRSLDRLDVGSASLHFGLLSDPLELQTPRAHHTATRIQTPDGSSPFEGQLLLVGGDYAERLRFEAQEVTTLDGSTTTLVLPQVEQDLQVAPALTNIERLDVLRGTSTELPALPFAHTLAEAAVFDDGAALVCAGLWAIDGTGAPLRPSDGCYRVHGTGFDAAPYLPLARVFHRLTRLADGSFLMTGGATELPMVGETVNITDRAQLYVPSVYIWQEIGGLNQARAGHSATLVPDAYGQVLITGGYGKLRSGRQGPESVILLDTAEVFDPARVGAGRTDSPFRLLEARLNHARAFHTSLLLADGTILILGGVGATADSPPPPERFSLETERFEVVEGLEELEPVVFGSVAELDSGALLFAGGTSARSGEVRQAIALFPPSE